MLNYFDQKKGERVASVIREKAGAYFHESKFTAKRTAELKWEAVNATVTNIAATVQSYGTEAKRVKRDDIVKVPGEIRPIEISYDLDEKLMLHLNNPVYRDIILDEIFNDTLNAYNAVRTRMDFIAMQQLSTGKVTYSATNNHGGIVREFVDYDLESWQEVDVSTSWATAATATPLQDIRTQLETLEGKGIYPDVIRMTKATFNQMVATTEVLTTFGVKVTKGGIQSGFISVAEMSLFFEQKDFPPLEIVRDDISYVSSDGSFSNTRAAWAEGIVQFGFRNEGRKLWVEPLESQNRKLTPAIVNMINGICVQQYSELNPPAVITLGKGIMFPVWDKSAHVLLLDTTP